ncbi:ribonuclease H-like domain-containing protein [Clostridium bowmanii]|uniref:ribonuclease H-like domain-containing protein n=1 Tax=Clostridium bowmanii TaxID=132925 RepID=UPI001C0BC126|nr:ribonuclease H-like domain-containing protein [Clostridium bowmanii]MBU3189481.1 ribonuclease H-like domain-containing protein [Clostridium bowmanii]MCA1074095.1 ribonuclease H-like domain-containing protein [Clostridium bowmanii]
MFIKEYENEVILPREIFKKYKMDTIAYLDIEATGFDMERDKIVLISLGYYLKEDQFKVVQYFAESPSEEECILKELKKSMKNFKKWCSYNGTAFDEPFVIRKMNRYNLGFRLPSEHVDLFRIIRPFHKKMGMKNCSLKCVEKFTGIKRRDEISGAKSVEIYNEYLVKHDDKLKQILMLHNYEDVLNLPKIFKVINIIENDLDLKRKEKIAKKQMSLLNNNVHTNQPLKILTR